MIIKLPQNWELGRPKANVARMRKILQQTISVNTDEETGYNVYEVDTKTVKLPKRRKNA